MERISEDYVSNRFKEVETYLDKILAMKESYQDQIDNLIDKYSEVLEDHTVLDEWEKEIKDIASIVRKHADKIRTRALQVAAKPSLIMFTESEKAARSSQLEKFMKIHGIGEKKPEQEARKEQTDLVQSISETQKTGAVSWLDNLLPVKRVLKLEDDHVKLGEYFHLESPSKGESVGKDDKPDPEPPDLSKILSAMCQPEALEKVHAGKWLEAALKVDGIISKPTEKKNRDKLVKTNHNSAAGSPVLGMPDPEPPDSDNTMEAILVPHQPDLEPPDSEVARLQSVNIDLTLRVKKPPDGSFISYQHIVAVREKPPDIFEDLHGECHDDMFYLDPPAARLRKPPDKLGNVSQVEEVLKIVCEASVPIKVIQFFIEQSLAWDLLML